MATNVEAFGRKAEKIYLCPKCYEKKMQTNPEMKSAVFLIDDSSDLGGLTRCKECARHFTMFDHISKHLTSYKGIAGPELRRAQYLNSLKNTKVVKPN